MKGLRILGFLLLLIPYAQVGAQGDPEVISRIIDEGKNRNQVIRHLEYLCIQIGPRLTGSSNLQKACEWTRDMFKSFGLQNAHLEQWGEVPVGFRRGPNQIARMVAPYPRTFQFTTRAWSAGTNGLVRGPAVKAPENAEAARAMKDQLKGAWVLMPPQQRGQRPNEELENALREAGIAGKIFPSRNELVITSGSWRGLTWENLPTDVEVTVRLSDYQAVMSALDAGQQPILEIWAENIWEPGPVPVYNVIADIPGTEKPEEMVIVSGHLDSWDGPGSQGTCDNGTGTMVALEAARLLMTAGAEPKRTIRFILWTGEEQGLLGSRAYVEMHKDELDKISAVLVDDGGTNYSGGLVCIESMRPMLEKAIAPLNEAFPELPVTLRVVESMPRGGGSDHVPFNQAGVPGFFWVETGVANYTYVHHTQHDNISAAIHPYLFQSSVAAAVTAYNLACADTLLPRQGG